jgi:type IV pilus biogenesis protein CpaD/CtpE
MTRKTLPRPCRWGLLCAAALLLAGCTSGEFG